MSKQISKFSVFSVCLLIATQAEAADLPSTAVYDWTGFYVGGSAGYSWTAGGGVRFDDTDSPGLREALVEQGVMKPVLGGDPAGFIGGLQAGFNWQQDALVVGFETDLSFADVESDGSHSYNYVLRGNRYVNTSTEQSVDWLGTTRVRLGFAADKFLVYGTGGLAYGKASFDWNVKYNNSSPDPNDSRSGEADSSEWKLGWTLGGGAEYALNDNWTVKAEYLYYDLGKSKAKGDVPSGSDFNYKQSADFKGNVVRAGVNYRF
jgi:outer membrane immunogenic protein